MEYEEEIVTLLPKEVLDNMGIKPGAKVEYEKKTKVTYVFKVEE